MRRALFILLVVILRVANFFSQCSFAFTSYIFFLKLQFSHDSVNIPKGKRHEKFALLHIECIIKLPPLKYFGNSTGTHRNVNGYNSEAGPSIYKLER